MRTFDRRPTRTTAAAARPPRARPLRVAPAHDAAEAVADRAADAAMRFDSPPTAIAARIPAVTGVQRDTPDEADRKANAAKADAELANMAKAVLAEAVTREPLKSVAANAKQTLATPAGKIAVAEVIVGVISASVLAKRPLPVTSFTLDLGDVSSSMQGATATLKWDGPANSPTKAGVEIGYSPPAGPLQGASVSVGGETSAKGPVTYGPNGPEAGKSIGIFDPLAQREAAAKVGVGYKLQGGALKGTEIKGSATASTGGGYGGTISLSIPLGSDAPKKKGPDSTVAERVARLRAEREAMQQNPLGLLDRRRQDETVQRSPESSATARSVEFGDAAPDSVRATIDRPGASLPGAVRMSMQERLGADFSRVRVHADPAAQDSARDIGAAAYTVGQHVVFGPGRWSPETPVGQRILAHELAHVVQQGGAER